MHALLYADDAVLMAHIPITLRRLVDAFIKLMTNLALTTNFSKSHIIACGPKMRTVSSVVCNKKWLTSVHTFSNLGITFDRSGAWGDDVSAYLGQQRPF